MSGQDLQTEASGAVSELINLKVQIDQENQMLSEERDLLKLKIADFREEKENHRKRQTLIYQDIVRSKLEKASLESRLSILQSHILWQRELLENLELHIGEQVNLSSFQDAVDKIRLTVEGALKFYSEDSLEYELMQRMEHIREKRVELTQLTAELEDKAKQIEAKRLERELEEKNRKEEEQRRKLEEERAAAAEILKPHRLAQPFRTVSFNGCSPEPKPSLLGVGIMSATSNGCKSETERPLVVADTKPVGSASFPSFSQLTRW